MEIAIMKKRGLNTENARMVRQRGHDDALEFALAIGLSSDYKNDIKAKKDVIDPSGDSHSVKSGEKKWQIFLYGLGRFQSDESFTVMNGIGDILIDCIESFPSTFEEYEQVKNSAKEKLRIPMRNLAEKLQNKTRLRAFLNKSIFNGGEVNYLTVKHDGLFHVFYYQDVIKAMSENFEVCNSRAISAGQKPEQKVLFRYKGINLGELEMRNDSHAHYREIRFNMIKPKVMSFLFEKILLTKKYNDSVLIYGNAQKKFGRWQ
jgi:hypothetical protein